MNIYIQIAPSIKEEFQLQNKSGISTTEMFSTKSVYHTHDHIHISKISHIQMTINGLPTTRVTYQSDRQKNEELPLPKRLQAANLHDAIKASFQQKGENSNHIIIA